MPACAVRCVSQRPACSDRRVNATQAELVVDGETCEELVLSRTAFYEGEQRAGANVSASTSGIGNLEPWRCLECPIPLTQNHKLVAPVFQHPSDVLIVRGSGRRLSPKSVQDINERTLPGKTSALPLP